MTISFACPHCGQKFDVETARAEETGPCAACGESLIVPNPKNRFAGAARSDRLQVSSCLWGALLVSGILLFLLAVSTLHLPRSSENARLLKCSINIKNIVLATQAYAEVYQRYPLASTQPFTGQPGTYQSPHPAGYSWTVGLLPFLDLHNIEKDFKAASSDYELALFDPSNTQRIPTLNIPVLLCPNTADQQVDIAISEYRKLQTGQAMIAPARSCYIAFAASHFTNDTGPGQLYEADSKSPFDGNGIFPFPKAAADIQDGIKMSEVTDGLSYTVMFCESRETAYAAWCDGQAMWAVGAWPGSKQMPTVHGGPNGSLGWPDSDQQSRASIGSGSDSDPAEMYLPASRYHAQYDRRWGPSSKHPGGVVVHAFADGHVSMLSPDIDRNLYLRLISRDGFEQMSQAELDQLDR